MFPAQLLHPSLQLLNTTLLGDVLLHERLLLFLLSQKPAPKIAGVISVMKVVDQLTCTYAMNTYFSN